MKRYATVIRSLESRIARLEKQSMNTQEKSSVITGYYTDERIIYTPNPDLVKRECRRVGIGVKTRDVFVLSGSKARNQEQEVHALEVIRWDGSDEQENYLYSFRRFSELSEYQILRQVQREIN